MGCTSVKQHTEPKSSRRVADEQANQTTPNTTDDAATRLLRQGRHIPHIQRSKSDEIRNIWNAPQKPLPEYKEAVDSICLQDKWITHTRLARFMLAIGEDFKKFPSIKEHLAKRSTYEDLVTEAVQKAYRLSDTTQARRHTDILHGCNVFAKLMQLFDVVAWRQPYLAYAIKTLLGMEEPDALVAKFSEVCDRAERCSSAQRQAFNMVIAHAFHLKEYDEQLPVVQSGTLPVECARQRFNECFEDFLDDHKERAFKSAFMEPARFYFHASGDSCGRDHVNVHGFNWYLAVLHAAAGVQLPLLPEYHDPHVMGLADFWAGLTDNCWECFSDPVNFGSDFEGISQLCRNPGSFIKKRVNSGEFPQGLRTQHPKLAGNEAVDPKGRHRKGFAIYIKRFAYFFTREVFVRRAFETLNAEVKPEHVGFRKACETLFPIYCKEVGIEVLGSDSFAEYCYKDEYFMELDIDRVEGFLAWMGVMKTPGPSVPGPFVACGQHPRGLQLPSSSDQHTNVSCLGQLPSVHLPHRQNATLCRQACPICCEDADDVAVLDHWEPQGDISDHKMCGKCRSVYGKNQCPFCKEILLKSELLSFITEFVDSVTKHARGSDPNLRAAVLERWQFFEMEYESRPAVIRRIARLIVEDVAFVERLDHGLKAKQDWLRDTAGILFRFHCLCKDGEVSVSAAHQKRLADAVEAIMSPFEARTPVSLDAHFYGALYTQALVPWLCAWRSGTSTAALRALVQRVGKAVVHCFQAKGKSRDLHTRIPERMHIEYIVLSQEPIWGSMDADVIWQNFFR